jgi:hypothetical protein
MLHNGTVLNGRKRKIVINMYIKMIRNLWKWYNYSTAAVDLHLIIQAEDRAASIILYTVLCLIFRILTDLQKGF